MAELDPAGADQERPYTKGRAAFLLWQSQKGQLLGGLTQERARQPLDPPWAKGKDFTYLELQLYNLRHVQEHAAQLQLFSGQHAIPAGPSWVAVGTATVAMVLNGLGFSNRRLYLTPQFYADKPVEHLLGPGIQVEDLNDDRLGRTLDWLYEHDVTRLFAGLALRARRAFGIEVGRLHADTTSFSVHGRYALDLPEGLETPQTLRVVEQIQTEADQGEPRGGGRGGGHGGADRSPGDVRLLARPSAGPEAVDAGAGHDRGGVPSSCVRSMATPVTNGRSWRRAGAEAGAAG